MGWDGRDGFLDHDYPFFEKFVCAKRPLSLYLLFFFFFFSKFSLSLILFHLFPSLFPIIPTPSAGVFGVHSFLLPSSLFFSFLLSGGGLLSLTHCMHLCNIPQTLPCHLSMYWQAGRQADQLRFFSLSLAAPGLWDSHSYAGLRVAFGRLHSLYIVT